MDLKNNHKDTKTEAELLEKDKSRAFYLCLLEENIKDAFILSEILNNPFF